MIFTIFGSGFGLYGYLPALIEGCGQRVLLPERYRAQLRARTDLKHFLEAVEWAKDDVEALACADALVVAQRPGDQVLSVENSLKLENIQKLLIEKPVATDPKSARRLIESLERSGKHYRIGYTFRHTDWGQRLLTSKKDLSRSAFLKFHWCFTAHHYASSLDNWKRHVSAGGGALRFFGIHLIALLAELGYDTVTSSRVEANSFDEAEKWYAEITGPSLPKCNVEVNTRSQTREFRLCTMAHENTPGFEVTLADPFDEVADVNVDRRVKVLSRLCLDLIENGENSYSWYEKSIVLWDRLEAR